jgi:hypothetical protein
MIMKFNDVSKKIKGVQKTVVSTARKVLAGLFGFFSVGFGGLTALFTVLGFTAHPGFLAGTAFFGIVTAFFVILVIAMLRTGTPTAGKSHYEDIATCETLLKRIDDVLDNQQIKSEFGHIHSKLKKELKNARPVAKKIDGIVKTMQASEWNMDAVTARLNAEKDKIIPNEAMVAKLEDQLSNIGILKNREQKMRDELAMLRQDFNSIYTKLTLLDTTERVAFDAIETEIQKILDRKLRVQKFEDQLDEGLDLE